MMKNLVVLLFITLFSFSLYAKTEIKDDKVLTPRPHVTILPYGVEVTIANYTRDDYDCNGSIFIQYESGLNSTELYYQRVYSGAVVDNIFYSADPADEVLDVYEAIFCYKRSK